MLGVDPTAPRCETRRTSLTMLLAGSSRPTLARASPILPDRTISGTPSRSRRSVRSSDAPSRVHPTRTSTSSPATANANYVYLDTGTDDPNEDEEGPLEQKHVDEVNLPRIRARLNCVSPWDPVF